MAEKTQRRLHGSTNQSGPQDIISNFMGLLSKAAQPTATTQPFTFRLPKGGSTDHLFGVKRSHWNSLILGKNPKVKSFVDCKPGRSRGIRLILYSSALEYFQRLANEQSAADATV